MNEKELTPKAPLTEQAVKWTAEDIVNTEYKKLEPDVPYPISWEASYYKGIAIKATISRLDLKQQLADQMAANENMVREKDQLSVELADTKTKLEAALDHIRCEESISPTLPGVAELQAEVELGRRRHSEYRDEAEGEFIKYKSELATLKARYAFHENQRLCDGYDGKCDGDLDGMAHEHTCPARTQDLILRPHLYGGTK